MLHRARHLFIRQQTAVINSIRVYLAEFGIVAPVGRRDVKQLLEVVADTADYRLPEVAGQSVIASRGAKVDTEDLTPEQQTFVGELAVRFAVVGGRLNYQTRRLHDQRVPGDRAPRE